MAAKQPYQANAPRQRQQISGASAHEFDVCDMGRDGIALFRFEKRRRYQESILFKRALHAHVNEP
jgi:hypothetical protein